MKVKRLISALLVNVVFFISFMPYISFADLGGGEDKVCLEEINGEQYLVFEVDATGSSANYKYRTKGWHVKAVFTDDYGDVVYQNSFFLQDSQLEGKSTPSIVKIKLADVFQGKIPEEFFTCKGYIELNAGQLILVKGKETQPIYDSYDGIVNGIRKRYGIEWSTQSKKDLKTYYDLKIDFNPLIDLKSQFRIFHEGDNVTNNKKNPKIIQGYPITVQLKDESYVSTGDIAKWEWSVLEGDDWIFFSNEQNPIYNTNKLLVTFRLDITTKSGKRAYSTNEAHFKPDPSVLEADFDIFYNGQNKTDNIIKIKKYPFTLNLKDKSKATGKIVNWEWFVYNWDKRVYDVFSSEQYPSMELNKNSPYISNVGEVLYKLKVKDDRNKIGEIEHNINVEIETTIDVKARIDAPQYTNQETGSVDGVFRFTATSEIFDLKSFKIIDGTRYINGNLTGNLSGKSDTKELSISIPVKRKISITVEVEDINGNKAKGTATHLVGRNVPPSTFISGPNPLYPRSVTRTGEYQNIITWSYFDSDEDEMVGTDYELYKITGDLSKDGPDALELVKDGNFYTKGMSEDEKREIRKITIEGDPGERFRLIVVVHDGKLSNEHDNNGEVKQGYWDFQNERWQFIRGKTVFRDFVVDTPKPKFELNIPQYQYIRENVDTEIKDDVNGYPNKFYPQTYTDWSIVESSTGRVLKEGTGKIIPSLYTEWEVSPKGERLNGGFYEGRWYTFKQAAVNIFGTTTIEKNMYIVPIPKPDIWVTEIYTLINQKVDTESYIEQPPVQNAISYGLPQYTQGFDEINSSFKIIDLDGKVLVERGGIFSTYEVTRDNGFIDSTKGNVVYGLEQYAENDKGHFASFETDLIILQTPQPTVITGVPSTYIDETVDVNPSAINELDNITTKNYRDFKDIYDAFEERAYYDNNNSNWIIENIDYQGNVINLVEKGTGVKKSIDVFRPNYEESNFYRLTQNVINEFGIEGTNASNFPVLTALPPIVKVEILERDDDPLTAKDKIYPREHLDIKTEITDEVFDIVETWWEIRNIKTDKVVIDGRNEVDGLRQIDLPIGEYKIVQYAKNEKDKIGEGFTTFTVRPVLPPVIDIVKTNLMPSGNNVLYMGDNLEIKLGVYDINKSEEHPNGYELSGTYAIRDKYTSAIIKEDGVSNINKIVDRSLFNQGMNYTFNQFAQNIEFPDKHTTLSMVFSVDNKVPIIELDTIEGSGKPPLFTGEDIIINVNAYDLDGYIDRVEYYINDTPVKETSSFILKHFEDEGFGTKQYFSTLIYTGTKREDVKFQVVAYDDYGAKVTKTEIFHITEPEIVTVIDIKDEDRINLKENRYIEFTLEDSWTNAKKYPLNFNDIEIYYQKDDDENWVLISDNRDCIDENIRIHYPDYPDKGVISSYFKEEGTYTLKAKISNIRGEKGEWGYKKFVIEKDLPPIADFNIVSPYHRITENYIELNKSLSNVVNIDNLGKSFFIFDDKGLSPDNDEIEHKTIVIYYTPDEGNESIKTITNIYEDIYTEESNMGEIELKTGEINALFVEDISNFNITYLTEINELGDYQFKYTVKERITQLPSKDNPLYNEIRNLAKATTSEPLNVVVDNIAPIVKIEVTASNAVNLIIHFDRQPAKEEVEKIDKIIKNLQSNGVKVNVIKKYGKY